MRDEWKMLFSQGNYGKVHTVINAGLDLLTYIFGYNICLNSLMERQKTIHGDASKTSNHSSVMKSV